MGMLEGAAGFGTSGYPLSSALRGGHGSPPPAQAGWVGDAASQPSHDGVGQPSLGWSHQLSLGGWLSTLHHGQQQSCWSLGPGAWGLLPPPMSPPLAAVSWCRPEERQNQSLGGGTKDPYSAGAPRLCPVPPHRGTAWDGDRGLTPFYFNCWL